MGAREDAVWEVMGDGGWYTIEEVALLTGYSENSVASQIRDFRKPLYGDYIVEKRRRVNLKTKLHQNAEREYEYRVVVSVGQLWPGAQEKKNGEQEI